jgi:branched-chain amino acid transport system permease protein
MDESMLTEQVPTKATNAIPERAPRRRRPRPSIGAAGLAIVLLALPVAYGIQDLSRDGNLVRLANNLFAGLSNGTIIALIAVGYTLVYGIIELINFAHGEMFMIGSFTAAQFWAGALGIGLATGTLGVVGGIVATLIVVMLVCGVTNVLIERVAYRPLRNAPKLAPLITAVGMSFVLQNVGLLWRGGSPVSVDDLIHAQQHVVTIFGIAVQRADLLAFAVTIPLVIAMVAFITRTRLGKAMRATAQDPDAARLMGINVDTTISATFFIGGAMAGAAGLVYALYETTIWYFQGFQGGLLAFTAAVMGGIGDLRGAVAGGLVIGCIQQLSDNRIGPEWTPAVVFAYLILIMVFRPQGLFGERTRDAG